MLSFETRRFRLSIAVGIVLTLLVCAADQIGLLTDFENWFYDVRAGVCQTFSKKPDDRIVHVDIDDAAIDPGGVGRWPWPRGTVARIIDEISRAKPAAFGIDARLDDEQAPASESESPSEAAENPNDDQLLASALAELHTSIVPVSFLLKSPAHLSREQQFALEELTANLELSSPQFFQKISDRGVTVTSRSDLQDLYAHTLKLAMRSRVDSVLGRGPITDDELIPRLLPHTDPAINSPVLSLLREEASDYRSRQSFRRFGLNAVPVPNAVVPCEFDRMPLPIFANNASYSAFVNGDLFKDPTLRSLPMLIEAEGKMYPQFGLAFGCAILGADVRQAIVEKNRIIIRKLNGGEIRIPTHSLHSDTLNRDFSAIADIPWFGTSEYLKMYDWPSHQQSKNHLSANIVWDICRTIDKIKVNNRSIDQAINDLLAGGSDTALDRPFAKKYADSHFAADDISARENAARQTLAKLAESNFIQDFEGLPAADRSPRERTELANLLNQKSTLETVVQLNRQLGTQLDVFRSNLAGRLSGKGILLGWTADGNVDVVNTSLHIRCPGVVVHGVIAEAVLSGRWWYRAPIWVGFTLILALGMATSYTVARLTPLRAAGSTFLLAAVYLLLNGYVAFDYGSWIVPVAGPVTAITVVWSGCTLQRVIFEGIERVRVATEVAVISREMSLAHKVQAALIPKHPPHVAGLEAEGWTQPASTTGGDCYDLWQLPDGRLAILLADASGHGLAPAMIVSQVRTLVRALSEVDTHPRDLFRRVNTRVAEDLEPGYFVTAFLGFLSADGKLEYAAAGHGPQYWYGCDGDMFEIESTGVPLGFDNEWICDESEGCGAVQICAGGTLVIFSDGFYEAMAPDKALFGIDRMKEILETNRGKSGKIIIDSLTSAVVEWQKQRPPNDDQTVVVARRIDA